MKQIPLTQGYVAFISDCDAAEVGKYKWCAARIKNHVYAVTGTRDTRKAMHRFIAGLAGMDTSHFIDHRDRNGLNNTRRNLRPATRTQNTQNQKGNRKCLGVCRSANGKNWRSHIKAFGRRIHLGTFRTKAEALAARRKAERKYFKDFAPR
jgi:hypothetical protein